MLLLLDERRCCYHSKFLTTFFPFKIFFLNKNCIGKMVKGFGYFCFCFFLWGASRSQKANRKYRSISLRKNLPFFLFFLFVFNDMFSTLSVTCWWLFLALHISPFLVFERFYFFSFFFDGLVVDAVGVKMTVVSKFSSATLVWRALFLGSLRYIVLFLTLKWWRKNSSDFKQ